MTEVKKIHIRPAKPSDAALLLEFICELARYEKAESSVLTDEVAICASLFAEKHNAYALICEYEQVAIGYAVYFFNYSTWLGRKGIYLEDIYIRPEYRGLGAGKALLQSIAQIALDHHCARMEWSVLDWNTPAIDFYRHIGAVPQDEWTVYRLQGSAIKQLATSTSLFEKIP